MNFQQSLCKVLSDPSFIPPECLFELNLKGDSKELLKTCSKEVCVRFAINEAKLVLPVFEAEFPNDFRPRKAILAVKEWLRNPLTNVYAVNIYHAAAIDAANAAASTAAHTAYYAARAAAHAAEAATNDAAVNSWRSASDAAVNAANDAAYAAGVANAAYFVRWADQLKRLFNLIKSGEND